MSSGGTGQEFGIYSGYATGTDADHNFDLPNVPLQRALTAAAEPLSAPPFPGATQIVVEEATTNQVTNPRPASATGWAANATGNTIAYASDDDGGHIVVTVDGSTASQGIKSNGNNLYPAAQGETWTFSCEIDGPGGQLDALIIQIVERSGATGATFVTSSVSEVIRPGEKTRFSHTRVLTDPTTTFVQVQVRRTGAPRSSHFNIRRMQFEKKAYATTYVDGDQGAGYAWTGTANASTSTRVAATVTTEGAHRINVQRGALYARFRFDSVLAGRYLLAVGTPGSDSFIGVRTAAGATLEAVFREGSAPETVVALGALTLGREQFVYLMWDGAAVAGALDRGGLVVGGRTPPPTFALAGVLGVGSLPNGTLWANARIGPVRASVPLSEGQRACWEGFSTMWTPPAA